ncbi:MAG: acetolactate decarboxylase [Flavobacteriales bacterium]|nr:acetolactate decarboxylase [Flavobacteriales bacterium]MCB9191896.1 acetolactate decarboxylase [Flavobacteriales bacterium]MCB9204683.1 acetolactate decarboxylase [Flavobacteriales bacterium]
MKNTLIILSLLSLIACSCNQESRNPYNVRYDGALKNIMRKGDLSAKADLADFQTVKHLYALGAVENLKGEILILDGVPFISSVQNGALNIDDSFNHKAALFVYAEVEEWTSFEIPKSVKTYDDLEQHVDRVAKENGMDPDAPFPFLLDGTLQSVSWHVIDWKDGDTEHSHEKHINSGLNGVMENVNAVVLGFYSNSHHAIFTHHTTNMHLHVKTLDNQLAGHVDDLILGENMVLKLPISKKTDKL